MKAKQLDVVQLKDGSEAVILEVYDGGYYVEFVDDVGKTIDLDFITADKIDKIIYIA